MLTRRMFLTGSAALGLAACARPETVLEAPEPTIPPLPDFYGPITDEPYPIPAVEEGVVHPSLWRQKVANPWPDRPRGTIVVDPNEARLYFVDTREIATRYGVSVGAAGFAWAGTARLQFWRDWPRWKVPDAMIERKPELAQYSWRKGGMEPGPGNPMGARALYLFDDGVDTLYRIHGDASARELGQAVSSGCIRMLDQDVIHLQEKAVHGADVVVLPSREPAGVRVL